MKISLKINQVHFLLDIEERKEVKIEIEGSQKIKKQLQLLSPTKVYWKFDCLKLKENIEAGEKSSIVDNHVCIVEDSSYENDYIFSVSSDCLGNSWILDSNYSYHMCPNRDWFVNY